MMENEHDFIIERILNQRRNYQMHNFKSPKQILLSRNLLFILLRSCETKIGFIRYDNEEITNLFGMEVLEISNKNGFIKVGDFYEELGDKE